MIATISDIHLLQLLVIAIYNYYQLLSLAVLNIDSSYQLLSLIGFIIDIFSHVKIERKEMCTKQWLGMCFIVFYQILNYVCSYFILVSYILLFFT